MLPGGFVRQFGKLADEFLEDEPHLRMADGFGMQIDVREFLGDEIQQPGLGEPVNLVVEVERFKDITHGRGKGLQIRKEIFLDVVLIPHQLFHVERGRVIEKLPRLPQQERLGIHPGLRPDVEFLQDRGLGRFEHAIQPPEDGERQNDLPILGLLVVPAEEIGDGPDKRGKIRIGHNGFRLGGNQQESGDGLQRNAMIAADIVPTRWTPFHSVRFLGAPCGRGSQQRTIRCPGPNPRTSAARCRRNAWVDDRKLSNDNCREQGVGTPLWKDTT